MNGVKFFVVLLTVVQTLCAIESSPRVLICVDPAAPFSAQQLAEKTDAQYIETEQRNPYKSLLPACLDKPIVTITFEDTTPLLKKIRRLAHRCGYRYLCIKKDDLDTAVEKTKEAISSSPSKSSEIYHLSLDDAQKLYALQRSIDTVFVEANLTYWAGRGSLLGAVRHQGNLPWEDYLVLHILDRDEDQLKSLENKLEEAGLVLHYNQERDFYKIYQKEGDIIVDPSHPDQQHSFRYPVADLYVMTLECRNEAKDLYVHRSWFHYFHWNTENFTAEQIAGIQRVKYGPHFMPVPSKPELTLNQIYGMPQNPELWRTHGLEPFWDHRIESDHAWPGNSLVEIDDFAPLSWN